MKKVFMIIVLFLCIFLCGCSRAYNWEFRKDCSEVIHVSIINIETHLHNAEDIINTPPIKLVEEININELYEDILNLKMKYRFGMEPPFPSGYCILIYYGDYEYCILSAIGSGYIYYDAESKSLINESTDLVFNEEEFLNILNKYLKD